jgi:hypothetical protein
MPSTSGSRSLLGFPDPEEESTTFLKMLVTTHAVTQHDILEDLNLQQHH